MVYSPTVTARTRFNGTPNKIGKPRAVRPHLEFDELRKAVETKFGEKLNSSGWTVEKKMAASTYMRELLGLKPYPGIDADPTVLNELELKILHKAFYDACRSFPVFSVRRLNLPGCNKPWFRDLYRHEVKRRSS